MSTTAHLTTSDDCLPREGEPAELHISMGGVLPPFWLALFDSGSFRTSVGLADWPLLSSDRMAAVTRIQRREEHLLAVFGEHTSGILRALITKLATLQSQTLILDSTDMGMQFCRNPQHWREELQVMLSAFQSEPRVPMSWAQRLLGASATAYNTGWLAYFKRFERLKKLAATQQLSPQQLAGGSDDGDMPWENPDA